LLTRYFQRWILLVLVLLTTINLVAQLYGIRPIQDDYFILGAVSTGSVSQLLESTWKLQGGNLIPYAFSGLESLYTSSTVDYLWQRVFLISTVVLIGIVSLQFFKWVGIYERSVQILVFLLLLLSFEGLFTPLQIAAYSWAQTSLTHLWPILITLIVIYSMNTSKRFLPLFLIFGLLVGNSNAAESLWGTIAFVIYMYMFRESKNSFFRSLFTNNSGIFFLACLVGSFIMIVSPGFWNRANVSVGLPNSFEDLFARFFKSSLAFSFDLITHPTLYFVFLIGALTFKSKSGFSPLLLKQTKFMFLSSFLLFFVLILGTTAGYPAWHQSLGLFIMFSISLFLGGVLLSGKIQRRKKNVKRNALVVVLVVISLASLRTSLEATQRAHLWDASFQRNYCLIVDFDGNDSSQLDLRGPEVIYPIFSKGIEDIQTWDWMKLGYIKWVKSGKIDNPPICSEL
jgi:hypothetical protein